MKKITRDSVVSIYLTPAEVAESFCELDETEMALFFNAVANTVALWRKDFAFQLEAVRGCGVLNNNARVVMQKIGEYSEN